MNTPKSKTVFIEYSTFEKGQHYMTVIQTEDRKRIIIGRIYKEYSAEDKKYNYKATDYAGNPVFVDNQNLYELKKKFIEHGKTMAMTVPVINKKDQQISMGKQISNNKTERKNEIGKIREKTISKGKTKGETKENSTEAQTKNNTDKTKNSSKADRKEDLGQIRNGRDNNERLNEKEEPEPQSAINEDQTENNSQPELTDRESELEQLRDGQLDRGDDMDLER